MMKQLTHWGSILVLAVGPLVIKGDDDCCVIDCDDGLFKTEQVGTQTDEE